MNLEYHLSTAFFDLALFDLLLTQFHFVRLELNCEQTEHENGWKIEIAFGIALSKIPHHRLYGIMDQFTINAFRT